VSSYSDLKSTKVYFLSTYDTVYVWSGARVAERLRLSAMKLADKFAATCVRKARLVRVKQGAEPPTFAAHFPLWHAARTSPLPDPYLASERALLAMGVAGRVVEGTEVKDEDTSDGVQNKGWRQEVAKRNEQLREQTKRRAKMVRVNQRRRTTLVPTEARMVVASRQTKRQRGGKASATTKTKRSTKKKTRGKTKRPTGSQTHRRAASSPRSGDRLSARARPDSHKRTKSRSPMPRRAKSPMPRRKRGADASNQDSPTNGAHTQKSKSSNPSPPERRPAPRIAFGRAVPAPPVHKKRRRPPPPPEDVCAQ
jgi:hypothetical protein